MTAAIGSTQVSPRTHLTVTADRIFAALKAHAGVRVDLWQLTGDEESARLFARITDVVTEQEFMMTLRTVDKSDSEDAA